MTGGNNNNNDDVVRSRIDASSARLTYASTFLSCWALRGRSIANEPRVFCVMAAPIHSCSQLAAHTRKRGRGGFNTPTKGNAVHLNCSRFLNPCAVRGHANEHQCFRVCYDSSCRKPPSDVPQPRGSPRRSQQHSRRMLEQEKASRHAASLCATIARVQRVAAVLAAVAVRQGEDAAVEGVVDADSSRLER